MILRLMRTNKDHVEDQEDRQEDLRWRRGSRDGDRWGSRGQIRIYREDENCRIVDILRSRVQISHKDRWIRQLRIKRTVEDLWWIWASHDWRQLRIKRTHEDLLWRWGSPDWNAVKDQEHRWGSIVQTKITGSKIIVDQEDRWGFTVKTRTTGSKTIENQYDRWRSTTTVNMSIAGLRTVEDQRGQKQTWRQKSCEPIMKPMVKSGQDHI